jgi:universal stress protein E
MDKLTSILVVIDPADETRHVLAKAMVLARHFGARLELFLCDSENAYALSHAYDPTGVAAARRVCLSSGHRYLDAVRRSLAEDVQISAHVACESPLYEAIVHRVLETQPDLVLKSAAGHHPEERFTLDANDWQLARTCPAPLMLTRGQHWRASPRFAAAVDVTQTDETSLARSILQTAGFLALGCRGEFDVVFSSASEGGPGAHEARVASLGELVREFRIGSERTNVLQGPAEETLPAFAAQRNYDVLVMGALTHRRGGPAALLGTLTSKLVDALDCDFVLVKPEPYACPVAALRTASA